MPPTHHLFPTLRQMWFQFQASLTTERGLLRVVLYAILLVAVIDSIALRVALARSGGSPEIYAANPMPRLFDGKEREHDILRVTSWLLVSRDPTVSAFAVMLCLVGLASTCRPRLERPTAMLATANFENRE